MQQVISEKNNYKQLLESPNHYIQSILKACLVSPKYNSLHPRHLLSSTPYSHLYTKIRIPNTASDLKKEIRPWNSLQWLLTVLRIE